MKSTTAFLAALGLLATTAGAVLADDAATPQPAPATQPAPAVQPAPAAQPEPAAPPAANAAEAPAPAPAEAAAKKTDPKVAQKASAALDAAAKDVDKAATSDGDPKIAERLAADFGTTPDALLAEKNGLQASWGSLMIAHSITANSAADVPAKQILDLRAGGKSWGEIADDMGFHLGEFVKAAREEAKVAKGLSKPDGKVAVVHGSGSKFGMSAASAAKAEKAAKKEAAKAEAAKADAAKADEAKTAAPEASTPATPGADNSSGAK